MKLEVTQSDFSEALLKCSRFASSRSQLPVLGNILLVAEKNKLRLAATNLEMSISVTIGAKVAKEGSVTVPAKVISEIIQTLPKSNVLIEVEKEKIKVESENFNSTLSGMNSLDFPGVPRQISKESLEVDSKKLVYSLEKVLFNASIDETRPVLTGVLFEIGDKSSLVATDGFRLSKSILALKDGSSSEGKAIIPKNPLSELVRLAKSEEKLSFHIDSAQSEVVFSVGNSILTSRIIEGVFPNYEKIIPKTNVISVICDAQDLTQAVKRAGVIARDGTNTVIFEIGREFAISAESSFSGRQKSVVDAKIDMDGEALKIAFNYRFLEEFLNHCGDNVKMEFNDANAPGVFLDPEDGSYLHLIMPIKI